MNNEFKASSLNRKSYRKFVLSGFSVTCLKHVVLLWPISALDRKQVRGSAYFPLEVFSFWEENGLVVSLFGGKMSIGFPIRLSKNIWTPLSYLNFLSGDCKLSMIQFACTYSCTLLIWNVRISDMTYWLATCLTMHKLLNCKGLFLWHHLLLSTPNYYQRRDNVWRQ